MVMCDHCSLGKLGHVTKLHDIAAVAFKEAALRRKYFFAAGEQLADLDGGTVGQTDMDMLILRFQLLHIADNDPAKSHIGLCHKNLLRLFTGF